MSSSRAPTPSHTAFVPLLLLLLLRPILPHMLLSPPYLFAPPTNHTPIQPTLENPPLLFLSDILPTTPENAWETNKVVDKAAERDCKRSATINALNKLTEAGTIGRVGKGKKGDPRKYYKPLPGDDEGLEKDSFETPSLIDQTNKTNPATVDSAERGAEDYEERF